MPITIFVVERSNLGPSTKYRPVASSVIAVWAAEKRYWAPPCSVKVQTSAVKNSVDEFKSATSASEAGFTAKPAPPAFAGAGLKAGGGFRPPYGARPPGPREGGEGPRGPEIRGSRQHADEVELL